ncbi:ATP-dependent DNA helicase RecG [Bifidobacterium goeldii]|uniref:ATP-dependent DNA helicase RecG n=1 Tax=Bifidobacterium goeldii TaxID=2306975 RepID=A0A430FKZ9_9BIFI|nr:ATP-dependent DNA helicase RecG [Bifidobacterium goeldii]RSX53507.1 ATP-dependent DNA helicase RecG [Bifidobacterium goeldii]
MSITLQTPISSLMTNKRRVGALKSLGIVSINDALTYYPFRVTDPVPLRALREAKIGEKMAFAGVVRDLRAVPMNARRGYRLEAVVDDSDFAATRGMPGAVTRLVFFSYKKQYVDWMSMRLRVGSTVVVSGDATEFNGQIQFTHPEIVTVAPTADEVDANLPGVARMSALRYDADDITSGLKRVSRPRPVYHATSRISSEHIHESILLCLRALAGVDTLTTPVIPVAGGESADDGRVDVEALGLAIPDIVPEAVRSAKGLMHRAAAFAAIHDPNDVNDFKRAIETLRYEEAFVSQTALLQARGAARKADAQPCENTALRDQFIDSLPFALTGGQRAVIDDIAADMSRDWPMQRLLQGEVGSGKTVVAVAAMLQAVGSGHQAVLVAPTQVLAEQHAETIRSMVGALDNRPVLASSIDDADNVDSAANVIDSDNAEQSAVLVILLTGGMKLAARRRALAQAASGEPCIIVATHAAFSKTFQAPNLALAVIDEQHRFGVEQRESLRDKADKAPHVLVMTATPIPRTAAMTWFGDLDISWLTELPGGRKPIRTFIVPEADSRTMGSMFAHIRKRIDAGERAYVVCPRIDADDANDNDADGDTETTTGTVSAASARSERASELFDSYDDAEGATPRPPLHSVEEIRARLASLPQFNGIAFATLTGRDDDATKQRVMADFAAGITPILIATTVIEVGVDVPQASCIVIFDADRYGLSQLHQLRGRVGRGGTNSWAFLISRAEAGSPAEQRLQVIQGTLDGAQIAEADLEFRGAGDVLGDAQSGGKSSLKLLRVVKDAKMIADARERAEALLAEDPTLADHVQLAGAVLDFTRGNESFLTSS